MTSRRDTVVPSISTTGTVNDSNHDLAQSYCRLYRHSSVLADGKIYIDGGNTYIPNDNATINNSLSGDYTLGMNDQFLILDLSQNFTTSDTFPYRSLRKNPHVPNSLIENSLLYSPSTRKVTQVGGWFSYNTQTDPGYVPDEAILPPSIWQFDIDSESWSNVSDTTDFGNEKILERPGAAAYCDALPLNKSFVFGGQVWRRTDPEYDTYVLGEDMKFVEGMLMLDTSDAVITPTLTNISLPTSLDNGSHPFGPRLNGAMVHIPSGGQGALVFIGGQTPQNPTDYGIQIPNAAQYNVMLDNTFVDIYDIQSGGWFRQQTFGVPDIPSARSDTCVILVTAEDGSSYNIFMIAGRPNYKVYLPIEEIWVLTIPTFQWILVHTRPIGRYGHTCHSIGENILLIGGMPTQTDGQDVQTCSDIMPAEVFNLATLSYTGTYDAPGASRAAPVPFQVVNVIGGTSSGGATLKTPKVWSNVYLQYVFDHSLERPEFTPTYKLANESRNNMTESANNGDNGLSTATIIGAAVGGALGACVLTSAILAIFVIRRRRKREIAADEKAKKQKQAEVAPFLGHGNDDKQVVNLPGSSQSQAAELDLNSQPSELQINFHPIELYAPPSVSEVSASPIGSSRRGLRDWSPGSAGSLSFSQHRSLSVRTT